MIQFCALSNPWPTKGSALMYIDARPNRSDIKPDGQNISGPWVCQLLGQIFLKQPDIQALRRIGFRCAVRKYKLREPFYVCAAIRNAHVRKVVRVEIMREVVANISNAVKIIPCLSGIQP